MPGRVRTSATALTGLLRGETRVNRRRPYPIRASLTAAARATLAERYAAARTETLAAGPDLEQRVTWPAGPISGGSLAPIGIGASRWGRKSPKPRR